MTCSDFFYTPDGRRGIGINQPQSGLDYPFISPSDDIKYLIADCRLAYSEQDAVLGQSRTQAITHPLRIQWLYGVGCLETAQPAGQPAPTHSADILIVDSLGVPVFNSTEAGVVFNTWSWGERKTAGVISGHDYQIYEWVGANGICHIIAYKTWPLENDAADSDTPQNYLKHIVPQNAVLDERAVYKMPRRVVSFILPKLAQRITNPNINFAGGYNTELTPTTDVFNNLRRVNQISVNATPGAGLGRYQDCDEDPKIPITNINGISGPDVLISASDCLWARTPGTVQNGFMIVHPTAKQQFGSDCPACCTCQDYVDIAKYMNATRDRYKFIGVESNGVLAAHADNIARWSEQQTCRTAAPIKACMTPQRCPYLDVVVQYCNVCQNRGCAENVVLEINFTAQNNAIPVCGYSKISTAKTGSAPFRLGGAWPNFTAALGNVDAGNSANVSFRLLFAEALPTNVKLSATGTTSAGIILAGCDETAPPAEAITAKSLYCDDAGDTTIWCE